MRKRILCALWMAVFVTLAGVPAWYASHSPYDFLFWLSASTTAPFWMEVVSASEASEMVRWLSWVSVSAIGGAVTAAVIQTPSIGQHSNLLRAALVGIVSAALALPVMLYGIFVLDDPLKIVTAPSVLLQGVQFALFMTALGLKTMWWSLLPLGAVGGVTLQYAWQAMAHYRQRHAVDGPSA